MLGESLLDAGRNGTEGTKIWELKVPEELDE